MLFCVDIFKENTFAAYVVILLMNYEFEKKMMLRARLYEATEVNKVDNIWK